MILSPQFFNRPALKVARELLGKFLVRKIGRRRKVGMITEVEAYVGPKDRASHAFRGRTKRTEVMFGGPGYWYVYLIYGMYYCLNIVVEKKEYPAAILIRSVVTADDKDKKDKMIKSIGDSKLVYKLSIRGPGRVCKFFRVDKRFNAQPANKKTGLWIEDRSVRIPKNTIGQGKRIGVDYAGEWKDKPWRFYVKV